MIKNNLKLLRAKILWIAIILTCIYFFCLHPISGILGGFIFLLIGSWMPSVINLLFSYWLSCWIVKVNNINRWLVCVMISIILGLNILLLNLFFYRSPHVEVQVIKPLHKISSLIGGTIFIDDSAGNIKPFLINLYTINGNESCGCVYFKTATPIYNDVIIINSIKDILNIKKSGSSFWAMSGKENANYLVTTKTIPAERVTKEGDTRFVLNIRDRLGGSIDIKTDYPSIFFMVKPGFYRLSDQKPFWPYAFNLFVYHNFWYSILHKQLEIRNVFDVLSPLQKESLFNESA